MDNYRACTLIGEDIKPAAITDYSDWIDVETWAFIERTNACYPENSDNISVQMQRDLYNAMCRQFYAGYPSGVIARDGSIAAPHHDIPIRQYEMGAVPAAAHVIYYHGGGFVVGDLESHDDVCAEICARTGYGVTSVDYRLAPKYPYPACFDDAYSAFNYVFETCDVPIILVGDSAGGTLAAAVCEATKNGAPKPAGQVLIYPALGLNLDTESSHRHGEAPMLNRADCAYYFATRSNGVDHSHDPKFAPLYSDDFSAIPSTIVISAQIDPLCDDGRQYVEALVKDGARARWICETGLVHGYLRARHSVKRASDSFDKIIESIAMLGQQRWNE